MQKKYSTALLVHGTKMRAILFGKGVERRATPHALSFDNKRPIDHDFGQLPEWLQKCGVTPFFSFFDSTSKMSPGITRLRQTVRAHILHVRKKFPQGKILLIGHSLGGIIIQSYIESELYDEDQKRFGNFLEDVVLVGVPHAGTAFASHLKLLLSTDCCSDFESVKLFSQKQEMRHFQDRFPPSEKVTYHVVVGHGADTLTGKMLQAYTWLTHGPNDGVCSIKSGLAFDGPTVTKYIVDETHDTACGQSYFLPKKNSETSHTFSHIIQPVLLQQKNNRRTPTTPITIGRKHSSFLPLLPTFVGLVIPAITLFGCYSFIQRIKHILLVHTPLRRIRWSAKDYLRSYSA